MFACTVPPAEDVLHDWAHPDCSVVRERAPYLPLGATRSCVHNSSRAVTHSRGERFLSWGQHLCSPAKKARLVSQRTGSSSTQHALCCIYTGQSGGTQRWAEGMLKQTVERKKGKLTVLKSCVCADHLRPVLLKYGQHFDASPFSFFNGTLISTPNLLLPLGGDSLRRSD